VDGRKHSNLLHGILAALPEAAMPSTLLAMALTPLGWVSEKLSSDAVRAVRAVEETAPPLARMVGHVLAMLAGTRLSTVSDPALAINAIHVVAKFRGQYPVLIVDEANRAINANDPTTLALLSHVVAETKQNNDMIVLLATSEYSYPHGLAKLTLPKDDKEEASGGSIASKLTKVMFAGEVPPSDMRDLLVGKCGAGPALADALLAHYGGHIHTTVLAVNLMAELGEDFDPLSVAGATDLSTGIVRCIKLSSSVLKKYGVETGPGFENRDALKGRMRATLEEMARRGFCPLDETTDPVGKIIDGENVGGVVSRAGIAPGLPDDVWGAADCGVVPTSQFARILIARKLAAFKPTTESPE
jgi:hypothetical protein